MKTKQKTVYYCDYCKKHTLTPQSMTTHEKHCTSNPNRKCRFCEHIGGGEDLPVLIEMVRGGKTLSEVTSAAESCPACILAAIKQAGVHGPKPQFAGHDSLCDFDYEKASAAMFKVINETRWEGVATGGM